METQDLNAVVQFSNELHEWMGAHTDEMLPLIEYPGVAYTLLACEKAFRTGFPLDRLPDVFMELIQTGAFLYARQQEGWVPNEEEVE